MKKTIVVFAMALLFPAAALPYHSSSSGGRGGGGSFRGGGRGGGFSGGGRGGFGGGNRGFTNFYRGGSHSYYGRSYGGNRGYWGGRNRFFNRTYGSHNAFNRNYGRYIFNGNRSVDSRFLNRPADRGSVAAGRNSFPGSLQHSTARPPSLGPDGRRLSASAFSPRQMNSGFVRNQMGSITGDRNFRSRINGFNQLARNNPNHYFWHNYGGWNYCNYCDGFGCNWYGWYCGGGFFWTQYYGGLFWWNDPWYGCWDYWADGCWNWPNPVTNTVYVYENGQYEPSQGDGGANSPPSAGGDGPRVMNPGGEGPGDTSRREGAGMILFESGDNSRAVKLVGDARDAFLMDTDAKALKPVFLDTGVKGVRFTGVGKRLKVQLTLQDGSVETFKADGEAVKGTTAG